MKSKIVLLKFIFELLSITNWMIWQNGYQWQNWLVIMQKMHALASRLLNRLITPIFRHHTTNMLTLTPNERPLTKYQLKYESWELYFSKIFIVQKIYKSVMMINIQSLKVMPWALKFCWILNRSKVSKIASWKLNSFNFSEYYIEYEKYYGS